MFTHDQTLKIIAIGAHPDDIELACGGTIAKACRQGHIIKMVIVTGKSSQGHSGMSIRTKAEAKEEACEAATILGVKDLEVLGYEDMAVPYSARLISQLDQIITDFRPNIILTHFPFDTHQDHIHTAQSTISAARRFNTILMYEPINQSGRGYVAFRPQVYIDISEVKDQKMKALQAHHSQHKKYGNSWLEAVEARARYRGFEMNAAYAECFELVRMELVL
jgi:LmbE family N-acetylglucosaminyl deacetylase